MFYFIFHILVSGFYIPLTYFIHILLLNKYIKVGLHCIIFFYVLYFIKSINFLKFVSIKYKTFNYEWIEQYLKHLTHFCALTLSQKMMWPIINLYLPYIVRRWHIVQKSCDTSFIPLIIIRAILWGHLHMGHVIFKTSLKAECKTKRHRLLIKEHKVVI